MSRDPKLNRLRRMIRGARADERAHPRKARFYKRKAAKLRLRITVVVNRRRDLTKVAVLDGTPITREQKIMLLWARAEGHWLGLVNSGDRRTKIAKLLRSLGKSTQAALYKLFLEGRGAPANPPTQGTHLRLGDGVIGVAGEPIPAYMQGLDTSYGPQLREILNAGGFEAIQPYPDEEWHTCVMKPIKPVLVRKGLV